jgi:hypothetical protein
VNSHVGIKLGVHSVSNNDCRKIANAPRIFFLEPKKCRKQPTALQQITQSEVSFLVDGCCGGIICPSSWSNCCVLWFHA